jgi:hypothetical protein
MVLLSTWMDRVANSTPIVDFVSKLNSFRVKRDNRFDLPTPLSPIKTTVQRRKKKMKKKKKKKKIKKKRATH